jgi:natural product precursor
MKKQKKTVKKLTLSKDTIRDLSSPELEAVAGGGFNTEWLTCTSNYAC